MAQVLSSLPQHSFHLLFNTFSLSVTPSTPSMNTCRKNKSAHPGIPDMTPSQLASAGLSRARNAGRPSNKKPTKDQQIATLRNELRAAQELISSVTFFLLCVTRISVRLHTFSRAVSTTMQCTMAKLKHLWTWVATLTLRLMLRRLQLCQAQNTRLKDQPQPQSTS